MIVKQRHVLQNGLKFVKCFVVVSVFLCLNSCGIDQAAIDKSSKSMCPSDGVNLQLTCHDGKEKIFPLGFRSETFYVRNLNRKEKKETWLSDDMRDFCAGKPSAITVYFKNVHLKVRGQRPNRTITDKDWRTAENECIEFEFNDLVGYTTIAIEMSSIDNPKPEDTDEIKPI